MTQRRMHPLTMAGLAFLAIAGLIRMLLHRSTRVPENTADLVVGLLYGLAIGCMILGIWKGTRRPA